MSKYFTLQEMTHSNTAVSRGIPNVPNADQVKDLKRLIEYLDPIREEFRQAIGVTSGFRSKELNRAIGGAKNSQHMLGQAADIVTSGAKTLRDLFDLIRKRGGFHQLIWEQTPRSTWIHVSIPPEGESPKGEILNFDGKKYVRMN